MELITGGHDTELSKREAEYYNVVGAHRNNVVKAYEMIVKDPKSQIVIEGIPVYNYDTPSLEDAIKNHDMSKYSDAEFYAYRKWHNPTSHEKFLMETDDDYRLAAEAAYEEAWDHHKRNNDHHPEWWCYDENGNSVEPRDMTIEAILHMICDWQSCDMTYGGNIHDWWTKNKGEKAKVMSENTFRIVESIMEKIPSVDFKRKI